MIPKTLLAGFSALFVAYLFSVWNNGAEDDKNDVKRSVIAAWKSQIKAPAKEFKKLAVGINANLDVIVSGVALLEKLGVFPGKAKNHETLNSLSDLQETFYHFFTKGSAAERVYLDAKLYQKIINAANSLSYVEHYIGGNAALMATKAADLFPDVKIQFVGPVGPKLKDLMPKSISIPESSHISQDEVHLIMEYKVGEKWGETLAPVANRFISSYDKSNSEVTMLETFFSSLDEFNPDLVLVSGLHMLDGQTPEFFSQRINVIVSHLQKIPSSTPVHLEFASMASKDFVSEILHKVLANINSLGLNDQELVFSSQAGKGPHGEDFDDHGQPEIYKISDIILWLLKNYGNSKKNPQSKLTRVHFHSLTYHIVGTVAGRWSNMDSAVAAGTRIAGQQACDVKAISPDMVDIKIPLKYKLFTGDKEREFNPANPVSSYSVEGYNFVFSPVLVCKNPLKTVGLGDAISATGLMYSQFNPSLS